MKDYILISLVAVVLFLLLSRTISRADEMSPGPSSGGNCSTKKIHKNLNCALAFPGKYEKDGEIVGNRKFCCA